MKISYQNRRNIDSLYSLDEYLQTKNIEDLPDEIVDQIKMVSLPDTKEGDYPGIPFGSYINRIADYFGDIDVIQLFSGCCSKKEVGIKAAKAIQELVVGIKKKPDHYFSEFKAGIDHAYFFNVGSMTEGIYRMSDRVIPDSEILYKKGLLSDTEIKVIRNIAKKGNKDGDDYDTIFNLFRNHFLLRWDEKEILQGWKEISTGKYYLSEAVLDHTAVKIDMILINPGGKFIEVTNFMALGLSTKKNEFIPINLNTKDTTPESLSPEIEKLYYSNYHYNPFKIVKRSFAFLKYLSLNWNKKTFDQTKYLERNIDLQYINNAVAGYIQILQSTINILYTIHSEMDAMKLVLERANVTKSLLDKMNQRLDLLKEPLANVLEIDDENLNDLVTIIDACRSEDNPEKKAEMISKLMKTLKEIINFWTIEYFNELGLNPPPSGILPIVLTYDPSIIREPEDRPINPLELAEADAEGRKGGFIKSMGKAIFQKLANSYRAKNKEKLPDGRPRVRMLYPGEYHYLHGNYIGPGTRVDLPEVRNYPPYNNVDNCARTHDLDYMRAIELPEGERQKAIIKADKKAVKCFAKYPNEEGSKVGRMGLNSKMKLGRVFPIVSNAIFGKISSGETKVNNRSAAGKIVPNTAANRYKADPRNARELWHRPGEDPEVQKQAFKDAAQLVGSVMSGNPLQIANAAKNIGQHLVGVTTKGSGEKKAKKLKSGITEIQEDDKKVWLM